MSEPTYPYSGANFKAHTASVYALGAAIVAIAIALGYVYSLPTASFPREMHLVLAFSGLTLFVIWIFQLTSFNSKVTAKYIWQGEQMEQILLNLLKFIDKTDAMPLEQKRAVLERYIHETHALDWSVTAEHIKHVHFKPGGSMCQILDILNRETTARVLKHIEENGGILPHQQVGLLNEESAGYTKIKEVIQP